MGDLGIVQPLVAGRGCSLGGNEVGSLLEVVCLCHFLGELGRYPHYKVGSSGGPPSQSPQRIAAAL